MEDAKVNQEAKQEVVLVKKGLFYYLFYPIILIFKGIFFIIKFIIKKAFSFLAELKDSIESSHKSKILNIRLYKKPIDEEIV